MTVLVIIIAVVMLLGVVVVARAARGGMWVVSRPTMRHLRMLRRGRQVPGRFLYARMLERRRRGRLP